MPPTLWVHSRSDENELREAVSTAPRAEKGWLSAACVRVLITVTVFRPVGAFGDSPSASKPQNAADTCPGNEDIFLFLIFYQASQTLVQVLALLTCPWL